MSAADELRKLDAQINGIPGSQVRAKLVLDALPEIIAVVESAQDLLDIATRIKGGGKVESEEWYLVRDYSRVSIAALSEKLES